MLTVIGQTANYRCIANSNLALANHTTSNTAVKCTTAAKNTSRCIGNTNTNSSAQRARDMLHLMCIIPPLVWNGHVDGIAPWKRIPSRPLGCRKTPFRVWSACFYTCAIHTQLIIFAFVNCILQPLQLCLVLFERLTMIARHIPCRMNLHTPLLYGAFHTLQHHFAL